MMIEDHRFLCHILTIGVVGLIIGYMAWKGDRL